MLFELAYLEEMRAFPLRKVLGMADTASRVLIPSNKVSYLYLFEPGKVPRKATQFIGHRPFYISCRTWHFSENLSVLVGRK
jgi:hypothetical protein